MEALNSVTNDTKASRRKQLRALLLREAKKRVVKALQLESNSCTRSVPLFATYSPTPDALMSSVWDYLYEQRSFTICPDELLVDLGCGDGRWLISGAKRFGCKALGIEIDEQLVNRTQENIVNAELQEHVQVIQDDIVNTDISNARLVIVYAFAESLYEIRVFLKTQLPLTASVLSIGFHIPDWKPKCTDRSAGISWYYYEMADNQEAV